jgi:hypothetical protein
LEADNKVQREDRLRSLERKRMYTIFAPLDANETLPRELLMEGRRHRTLGRRELAGALWLPALGAALFLAGSINLDALMVLGVVALLLLGFVVFAVSGERKAP